MANHIGSRHSAPKGVVPMMWFLLACTQQTEETCESQYSYEYEGHALIRTYCTSCHSQHLQGEKRYGTPPGIDFDTLEGIRQWSTSSAHRVFDLKDMPPGGGMSDQDREILASWLRCNAPGEELETPEINAVAFDFFSHVVAARVQSSPNMSNVLILRREIDFGGSDLFRIGMFSEEIYQMEEEYAYLLGYNFYFDHQTIDRSVSFDPPLPIYTPDSSWSIDLTMTIEEDGQRTEEWVHWEGVAQWATPIDAQMLERNPYEVRVYSDNGEEWGWQLSDTTAISAQWVEYSNGTGWTAIGEIIAIYPTFPYDFPLREGLAWIERVVEE